MDGISLYAIRHEIERYLPLKVTRIYHPQGKSLLFNVWSRQFRSYLMLSLDGGRVFCGMVDDKPGTPRKPSGVCEGLRKRLEGGTLRHIGQEGFDRVLYLEFSGYDNLGNAVEYTLVFDAAGGRGGLGLVSKGIVEFSVPSSGQRFAQNHLYIPPVSSKHDLIQTEDFAALAKDIYLTHKPGASALVSQLEGLGKETATGLLTKANLPCHRPLGFENLVTLAQVLAETKKSIINKGFSPALYIKRSGEPLLGALPFHHREVVKTYNSLLECTSAYWAYLRHFKDYTTLEARVRSLHKRLVTKLAVRFKAQSEDLDRTQDSEKYRVWAELIHSTGRAMPRGSTEMKVLDYYQTPPTEISIPLDPRFPSGENARRYYSKYAKLQRASKILKASVEADQGRLLRLEKIQKTLDGDNDATSLTLIQDELVEISTRSGIRLPRRKPQVRKGMTHGKKGIRKPASEGIEQKQGPDGSTVYIGTNAAANEYLIRHVRKPGDIWLHAKGVKGSHVLLRVAPGTDVTPKTLEVAARLAAKHSEAAASDRVEIDWVDAATVKKPKGSPPGFVTYKGAKSVMAKPYP